MEKLNKNEAQKYKAIFFDFGETLMDAEKADFTVIHLKEISPILDRLIK